MKSPLSQYIFIYDDGSEKASPHVRGSAKTSNPHIELHFKDRAYLVKRTKLSKYTSLSDATTSDPVVKVPADDEDMFKRLYDFIDRGEYKPSIKERQIQDPVLGIRRGPPHIVDFEANGKAFLAVDIKMYHLAMAVDFPELKKCALTRLRAQSFTNEDPCAILEYIYHGGPAKAPGPKSTSESEKKSQSKDSSKKPEIKRPDDSIRQWVKDWLQVKSESKDFSNNLKILQQHPLWTDKYQKLRERGSKLITDIDAIEAEIKKTKKEQSKPQLTKAQFHDRELHLTERLKKAVLEALLPGRPVHVPPMHNPQLAIPADYDFPLTRHPYAPRRSQDDSEIMPNSHSFAYGLREQDIVAAVVRNLAHAYPD
ncbi:hypothetical protein MMC30_004599 [Trapelia coarctata]|nr:hypothetical protein [Trapelia coarctata]